MKRILLLALVAAAFVPVGAHAAVPCRDKIYNQWYATGKISTTYPLSCYRDALKNIPSDAQVYSNLGTDIKGALAAAIARHNDPSGGGPTAVGSGPAAVAGAHSVKGAQQIRRNPAQLDAAPMAAASSSGTSAALGLPVPILVVGGIALALLAAGAVGTGVRQVKRRDVRAS